MKEPCVVLGRSSMCASWSYPALVKVCSMACDVVHRKSWDQKGVSFQGRHPFAFVFSFITTNDIPGSAAPLSIQTVLCVPWL